MSVEENDSIAVVVPPMKLENMLSMKGGNEESSYAKNSQAQARDAKSTLHHMKAAMDVMCLPAADILPFTIADLGCSCGANTTFLIDYIINHISKRYELTNSDKTPEFQAFFSDLPSNDFNTLFQLLPYDTTTTPSRSYYAAGVPGSFYRRLFPARSINVFSSVFSLHWLSQLPNTVTEPESKGYNKGKVFVHGALEATAEAYRKQFQSDLVMFLQCRAEEMRMGGIMFLVCLGRASLDPADQGSVALLFGTHFQGAWDDLVQEGLMEAEKRDRFNVPLYAANLQEFRDVVEANGQFVINNLELVQGGTPLVVDCTDKAAEVGGALVNSCRSVCEVLVEAQIGKLLSDKLFTRLKIRGTSNANELVEHLQFSHIVASLSLISK